MVNWVEQVGLNLVASLAQQAGVDLNSGIITLLENFGECVERESRNRHMHKRRLKTLHQELEITNNNVGHEVRTMRERMFDGSLNDSRFFFVDRHPETYLPIVCLRLKHLPDLVVHVPRRYGTIRDRVTFGLTKRKCGGRLSGLVAQAANQLTSYCKTYNWKLTVTDVITFWLNAIMRVPAEQRTITDPTTSDTEDCRGVKRSCTQSYPRQRGRWKARRTLSNSPTVINTSEPGLAKSDSNRNINADFGVTNGVETKYSWGSTDRSLKMGKSDRRREQQAPID